MDAPAERSFLFGEYALDEGRMQLLRDGRALELETKPLLLLRYLLHHAGRIVARDELLRELWPGISVSDASLKTAVYGIRLALGDAGSQPRFIATVRGVGYRFCAPVEVRVTAAAGSAPAPGSEPSFVDRETEMQILRRALAAAAAGERRLVFLHGPPGIGKTRTALELAREADARDFEVHVGRTHEGSGAPPFWAWRQILRSLAGARAEGTLRAPADFSAADVLRLAPELGRHFASGSAQGELGAEESRFRQLDGVTQLLCSAAQQRPLLLILDDLQWADEASLALLRFLARNLRRAPLLVVATHRDLASPLDDEVARAIRRAASESGAESIALRGLGREAIQQTLRRMLSWEAPERWIDEVLRATGGNPFFVLEVARLLGQRGEDARDVARIAIPPRLRDTVLMRIEERSASCQRLLRCASAIGERFSGRLLSRVAELRGDALLVPLHEALQADLIRADTEPETYRFAHGVVRDVLYALLPDAERIGLHAGIGAALEQAADPQLRSLTSELAHHFAQAAPLLGVEPALVHVQRAADEARAVHSFSEEAGHLRQALRLLAGAEAPDPELRSSLLLRLGWALSGADAPVDEVAEALDRTIALARELGRMDRLAHAAVCSARYARLKGHTTYALDPQGRLRVRERHAAALEEVLAAPSVAHPSLRGRVQLTLAGLAMDAGQHERARRLLDEALRASERGLDAELRASALIERFPLTALQPVDERSRIADELVEASRLCARRDLECFGHGGHAYLALVRGDRDALEAASAAIARLAAETRLPRLASAAATCRSLHALLDGHIELAGRESLEAVRILDAPPPEALAALTPCQWWSALLEGRVDRIPAGVESVAAALLPAGVGALLGAHLRSEADRPLEASDRQIDYAALLDGVPRDDGWLWAASLCVEQCAVLEQRELAGPLLELLLPHAHHGIAIAWISVCTGSLARPLALLAALLGRWETCEELVETALAHAESLRSVTLRIWAQVDAARALRRHPSARMRRRGAELGATALESARPLGLRGAELRLKRA